MRGNSFRFIASAVLVALCGACTTLGAVDASASLQGDSAYYVIGIAPAQTRVMIVDGDLVGGRFSRSAASRLMPFSANVMNVPQDGFLLGKVRGGTTLGIDTVFDESGWPARAFAPCDGGAKTVAFTPAAGTVVYLTSLTLVPSGDGLQPHYRDDFEGARAFLKAHYPNLVAKIARGTYTLAVANHLCGSLY